MIPIFQSNVGECGLASLAMIASKYGYLTDLATLQKKFPSEKNVTTLAELMDYATALCLKPRALRVPLDQIKKVMVPCILHWDRNHFVVLRRVRRSLFGKISLILIDPAMGEYEITLEDAAPHFSGVALELSPEKTFVPKDERIEAESNTDPSLRSRWLIRNFNLKLSHVLTAVVAVSFAIWVFSKTLKPEFDQGVSNSFAKAAVAFLLLATLVVMLRVANPKNNHELGLRRGLDLLLRGQFEDGWRLYEKRWKTPMGRLSKRTFKQPRWDGNTSLKDKRILIYAEQGLGDTIHFCRYVSMVADLGATIYFEVQEPLEGLMHGLTGVEKIILAGESLPEFDFSCPLLSLPGIFKTDINSIPNQVSYLSSKQEDLMRWALILGTQTKIRIGLVWSGNASHSNDHNRSMRLSALSSLVAEFPQYEFFSLQRDVSSVDQVALNEMPQITHFGNQLKNFSDTAALCALMDCIVSVDTSVAHLSAALGKPTFVMLPLVPDWRWLKRRSDSPWYPTITLLRQSKEGDWHEVVTRLKRELKFKFDRV